MSVIDWRQSARAADRLYIRQNEWEAPAAVHFCGTHRVPSIMHQTPPFQRSAAELMFCASPRRSFWVRLANDYRCSEAIDARFQGRSAPAQMLEVFQSEAAAKTSMRKSRSADLKAGEQVHSCQRFFSMALTSLKSRYELLQPAAQKASSSRSTIRLKKISHFGGRIRFQDLESNDHILFGDAPVGRCGIIARSSMRIVSVLQHWRSDWIGHFSPIEPTGSRKRRSWRFLRRSAIIVCGRHNRWMRSAFLRRLFSARWRPCRFYGFCCAQRRQPRSDLPSPLSLSCVS